MAKYRILSMDGGNALNTALLLNEISLLIEDGKHDYLDRVDLFAGTSAGGINSFFFAKHLHQQHALAEIFKFQKTIYDDILDTENAFNLIGAFVGMNPLARTDDLRAFYVDYFGQDLTLAELHHNVVIVTFVLDNQKPPPHRRWEPRIFTNLGGSTNADALVVDVLMRSAALPIAYPLVQSITGEGPGYVDGAVVANNPSMIAVTEVLEQVDLSEILVLSVGTGRNVVGRADYIAPEFTNSRADWGYAQWMLDHSNPLLLLDLLIQASEEAVSFQCNQLLKENHFRLNVDLQHGRVDVKNPDIQAQVEGAIHWLENSGWFDE